jgi:hypothetical protein
LCCAGRAPHFRGCRPRQWIALSGGGQSALLVNRQFNAFINIKFSQNVSAALADATVKFDFCYRPVLWIVWPAATTQNVGLARQDSG